MNDLLDQVHCSDNIEFLRNLPDDSIDSIVTDPPYGLSFMGKKWDYDVPSVDVWTECLRVLKPGGHLLAFAGTRTQHRMAVNIEDAGFEIRDMIAWVYGSGFPKSLDVSKAIDKAAGAEGKIIGERRFGKTSTGQNSNWNTNNIAVTGKQLIKAPATPEARKWNGWGTALKPALEPITVARKPFKGTVAENVLKHGTGGINVDGCRVGERFPANLIHDGSDEVMGLFPDSKTTRIEKPSDCRTDGNTSFDGMRGNRPARGYDGDGSAGRFFYCAKASKRDRDDGTERNNHPTVKPTDLMRYLCRLVTPPDGIVLDPFAGSGSTGKAALLEGFRFIGVEREAEYCKIANARIKHAQGQQIMKFEEGL